MQRRGTAAGWIPRQDCERAGDCPHGVPDGEEAAGDELPQARRGDRHQALLVGE